MDITLVKEKGTIKSILIGYDEEIREVEIPYKSSFVYQGVKFVVGDKSIYECETGAKAFFNDTKKSPEKLLEIFKDTVKDKRFEMSHYVEDFKRVISRKLNRGIELWVLSIL
jgi:hypothetical protein